MLQRDIDVAIKDEGKRQEFRESSARARARIDVSLREAGIPGTDADVNAGATLWHTFLEVVALDAGITPEQAFAEHFPTIIGPDGREVAAGPAQSLTEGLDPAVEGVIEAQLLLERKGQEQLSERSLVQTARELGVSTDFGRERLSKQQRRAELLNRIEKQRRGELFAKAGLNFAAAQSSDASQGFAAADGTQGVDASAEGDRGVDSLLQGDQADTSSDSSGSEGPVEVQIGPEAGASKGEFISGQVDRTLDEVYEHAEPRQLELEEIGPRIAEEAGAEFKPPPPQDGNQSGIKGRERVKAKLKGSKKPGFLSDVVRAGFIITDPAQAERIVELLRAEFEILDRGWKIYDSSYTDRKVLIRFKDGTVGEIQMWPPGMAEAKFGRSEELYNIQRDESRPDAEREAAKQEAQELHEAVLESVPDSWSALISVLKAGTSGKILFNSSSETSAESLDTTIVGGSDSSVQSDSNSSTKNALTGNVLPDSKNATPGLRSKSKNRTSIDETSLSDNVTREENDSLSPEVSGDERGDSDSDDGDAGGAGGVGARRPTDDPSGPTESLFQSDKLPPDALDPDVPPSVPAPAMESQFPDTDGAPDLPNPRAFKNPLLFLMQPRIQEWFGLTKFDRPSSKIKNRARKDMRAKIVLDLLFNKGREVRNEKKLIIVLGNSGSGKSTFVETLVDQVKGVEVDADLALTNDRLADEYQGGKGTQRLHSESAKIADDALAAARRQGMNIVFPTVGANPRSLTNRIQEFRDHGYEVQVKLVHVSPTEAMQRVYERLYRDGRDVPGDHVLLNAGTHAAENYIQLLDEGIIIQNEWEVILNYDPRGRGKEAPGEIPGPESDVVPGRGRSGSDGAPEGSREAEGVGNRVLRKGPGSGGTHAGARVNESGPQESVGEVGAEAKTESGDLTQESFPPIESRPRLSRDELSELVAEESAELGQHRTELLELLGLPESTTSEELREHIRTNPIFHEGTDSTSALEQSGGSTPRGEFIPGENIIRLTEKADLSTFLHESAHAFLFIMRKVSQNPNAPQVVRDDLAAIAEFVGAESVDALFDNTSQRFTEVHERFADAWLQYLSTGKAPTRQLRKAFGRFRSWLLSLYQQRRIDPPTDKNGNPLEITPEIKVVFDRMLSSENEIALAIEEHRFRPHSREEMSHLSDEEYAGYLDSIEDAKEEAKRRLDESAVRMAERMKTPEWRERRREVRDEVAEETEDSGVFRLKNLFMGKGKRKLDRDKLIESLGDEQADRLLKLLPRGRFYITADEGEDPEEVAERFGFKSVREMVEAIANSGNKRSAIDRETDRRMLAEAQREVRKPVRFGQRDERPSEALFNERYLDKILLELEAMNRKMGRSATPPGLFRDYAERTISRKLQRNIHPDDYLRAERRAVVDYERALEDDELVEGRIAKQRQIINHYLYQAAKRSQQEAQAEQGEQQVA